MASLILEVFLGYRAISYGYGQGGRKLPLFPLKHRDIRLQISIPGGPHIWLVFVLIYLYVLNAWVYHGMFSSSIARSLQIILPIAACSFLSFLSALAIDHTVMPVLDYVIEAVCRGKRKRDS